jgi:cobyric acid synthase
MSPTGFSNEDILPDDYPIYGNYLYVADGKVIMSDWHGITAKDFKRRENVRELRRCNIEDRKAAFKAAKGAA